MKLSTLNSNPIAKAVRTALLAGTAAALAMPAAYAAEDEEGEKVTITGSRIKRVDVETAQPVTVITREELDMSGDTSVADALRNTSANSFGSWKAQSGFGAGYSGSAEIDLRGVGATLVLIDGRRMPGAGYDGGQTQDLNNIPLAIVERIEILRSGASAIYGSDAVAGVVNIITRKEVDGAQLGVTYEERGVDDGSKVKYEFVAGASGDKASMLVVAEHQTVDEMTDRSVTGLDNGVSWYSPVANAFYYSDSAGGYEQFDDASLCGSVPNTIDQGFRCGYAYSNATWLYPQQDQDSLMTKFTYEVSSNLIFNSRLSYVNAKSHSRYAPTPISTAVPTMTFGNPNIPASMAADMDPNVDPTVYIYHRSALLGNRDSYLDKNAYDAVFGLEGFLEAGNGYDWTLNYQRTTSSENLMNTNLVNDRMFQAGLDAGDYDVFNVSGMTTAEWSQQALDFYETVAHTGFLRVDQRKDIVDGTFGGELFTSDIVTGNFVVGGEFEKLDFTYQSDPESGQGYISGGSGGDDVYANRDRSAIYSEFAFNFDFGLEVSAAARYDSYDMTGDVGTGTADKTFSDTTTMLSVAYRPMDTLLLRAVVGESFRAPSMNELFASRSFGFPAAYDFWYCDTYQGGQFGDPADPNFDSSYCDASNQPQHLVWSGGNPDLDPEFGDNISVGAVWNVTDDLVVEAQWYSIEYYDKITNVSLTQILLEDQAQNGNSTPVTRGPNNQIESIQSGTINQDEQNTFGWDFAVSYNMDTSVGQFTIKGDLTRTSAMEFVSVDPATLEQSVYNSIEDHDWPKMKANLQVSWSKDDYYAAWRSNYIAGQERPNDNFRDIDAVVYHNVQFGMYTPWDGEVVVGIRNLLDTEVEMYTDTVAWRNFSPTLYSPEGRTWTLRYEQKF
jgi:iron complex outermembrane receptor protein